jgi:hypothetical protein
VSDIPALVQIISILDAATGPNTPIPPTLLYNENWLMRLVLSTLSAGVTCLPFALEPGTRWFSEARLTTQFPARGQSDSKGEPPTHADGVVGHFSFGTDTKASLELNPHGSQFIVLEGKVFSKLRKDVKNAPDYDQVARTVGCMAECLSRVGKPLDHWKSLGFYLFAPKVQIDKGIFRGAMNNDSIRNATRRRIGGYGCEDLNEMQQWERLWLEPLTARLELTCVSWEKIIDDIKRQDPDTGTQIATFYDRTLEFNKTRKTAISNPKQGKGMREAFLVYIPQITRDDHTVLHLSVRGDRYKLRRYNLHARTKKLRILRLPGCSTIHELRASGAILKEFSVTEADMRNNIDAKPEYWCRRIEEVNAECFATQE